jgi:predicted AlkP superfamily phosphohydrolase/phosphomutase
MHAPTALLAPVAIVALACAGADTARPATPPAPPARRVVLLSLDGFGAARHLDNLRQGVYTDPDGVAAFTGGYVVERAIPVNPTLTAPSHASIATGAFPAVTGIVANVFKLPGAPIGQDASGFAAPWGAEPIWQAFRRQGKHVGVLEFPGCDGTAPSRTADFGTTYVNTPFAGARTLTFAASRFTTVILAPGWTSDSPARQTTFSVDLSGEGLPAAVTFTLTALDTSDDRKVDYDTLVVDDDADLGNGVTARVRAGEWFPLRLRAPHPDGGSRTVGGWCLLQALPANLDGVTVYRGGFYATEAYPRAFREALEAAAGFWPGPPDDRALARREAGHEGITVPEMLVQMRRFSEYFTTCAKTAIARERFELLLLDQPIVDEVEHRFLLVDPRQSNYTPVRATAARAAVTEAFRAGDRAVGELARALDLTRDALVIVSDHGMAPAWESVQVNQLLQHAGLAAAEKVGDRWRVAPSSRIAAYAGGGCAHLYVNLKGREPAGVVEPADMAAVIQAAAVALARAQVDGSNVVETIIPREGLAAVGLDAPASGDLVVFFHPGFSADSGIAAPGAPWHAPAESNGRHGYLDTHPEMAAIWLARGAGVPRRRVAEASLTQVAAFVSRLAGVEPPLQARR